MEGSSPDSVVCPIHLSKMTQGRRIRFPPRLRHQPRWTPYTAVAGGRSKAKFPAEYADRSENPPFRVPSSSIAAHQA